LLSQAAGKQSALALYDIGNLEFVYISRVPSASSVQTALWQTRTKFESHSAAGSPYFVHTDATSGRVVAFAITNDYLILATREDLIAGTLSLLAGGAGPKLTGEDWFAQAVSSAGGPGDIRMVLNMEKIAVDPHFRSYWIQPNAKEMRRYSAAISDLHLSGGIYQEDRVLLSKADDPAHATSASASAGPAAVSSTGAPEGAQAVADLLRLVPAQRPQGLLSAEIRVRAQLCGRCADLLAGQVRPDGSVGRAARGRGLAGSRRTGAAREAEGETRGDTSGETRRETFSAQTHVETPARCPTPRARRDD